MVSVKCETETCPLCDEVFNVIGYPETVQCGGCGVYLTPYGDAVPADTKEKE